MDEQFPWRIIDTFFNDNPNFLVAHHLDSYNSFFNEGIKRIFKEKNPIRLLKQQDPTTGEFDLKCDMYLGGKNGDRLYYGKPVIYDEHRTHFMYPNEARLRNMTYGVTIHYEVEVDYFIRNPETKIYEQTSVLLPTKIALGRFPIMLQSDLCILNGLDRQVRFRMGECRNDSGGYFIIDGKEKAIICQEKFADNMLYIKDKGNELYSHSAEIRSVSEDASKPIRTLSIKIVTPSSKYTNQQIVVIIPNVRKPIPLFILMRALGVEADRDIIDYCLLDREQNAHYMDLFIPSIHDAWRVFNQEVALKFIASFTKGKTIPHTLEILTNYLLPHVGEMNFHDKAYFIGYMVKQLLQVFTKERKATDRDNFRFKRVELTGSLLYDLFKEYYSLQQKEIFQKFDKEFYYTTIVNKSAVYLKNFPSLIENNYKEFFNTRIVADGFRKAFKGNWGAETHTKRIGVVQDVNRLSFNSYISQMRKLNLPLDASAKVVGPRLAHTTQWGIIDPIDTPDGGNVGLHKNLTIMAAVTKGYSAVPLIQWLRVNAEMLLLNECTPKIIAQLCKVLVNGNWVGVVANPRPLEQHLKNLRRVSVIPTFTSVYWHIAYNTLYLYTDAGRICRPVFYTEGTPSYQNEVILEKIQKKDFTWNQLITGFAAKKKEAAFDLRAGRLYNSVAELYNATDLKELSASPAILDYLDTSEAEGALIAMDYDIAREAQKPYTHIEIHPSLMMGVMGNQVIFPENNQFPRNLFGCGQARQAISLYHSNFQVRVDKTGIVLNNGQCPLVKSRYLKYINNEEHPCGENTIVAIMSFNGYNVEDSILFNEGSLKRGLFRTTYYSVYESREESSQVGQSKTNSFFTNIENLNVVGKKPDGDYAQLDEYGLIRENTLVTEDTVLIGKATTLSDKKGTDSFLDASSLPKKGQKGYVDRAFMTEGEQGFRIAKVRIRNERIPDIGDKFCSRCGQKGTVGLVIPEADMPFTADGIKPDIIINPHAIPSRMTIGQLVESLMGKACTFQGAFGDCTAFVNKSNMIKEFGDVLTENGFHSSGNDILYNGQTGEQISADIFMGPTYYMRLKHMVKDKINYRARGPRTALTRQTVQGRANDGGLRIGEMERDGLIAHGITGFLQESMLTRGDEYFMAVCNNTGTLAIYNEDKNLFLSPFLDGPLKFNGTLDDQMKIQTISQYGRSFSIVRVPFSFKLLLQELTTMNVQLRLITEATIDQLTHLSFSDNLQQLAGQTAISLKELAAKGATAAAITRQDKKNLAALGFNKLPSPPFKKWRLTAIPAIGVDELAALPSEENREYVTLEPAQENQWIALRQKIDEAKTKLDEIPSQKFQEIMRVLDSYAKLRGVVQKTYNMEHATNAALKMYEMINQFQLLTDTGGNCLPEVSAFCNAELPGAFVIAINHYMRTKCISSVFDWVASSYLLEAAMKTGDATIIDDNYNILARNKLHWFIGEPPNALPSGTAPITGDVRDPEVVKTLGNATHQRFASTGGATIYTSDIGIELPQQELNRQEELMAILNYGQIVSGLLSLAVGGSLVTKQFTFTSPFSRSLIALVASLFAETYITKPKTSRPANSEIYLVGKGFKGLNPEFAQALVDRAVAYNTLGKLPTEWGSLVKPDVLAQVDAEILAAAQEVHGEQQVTFLNEIADAYRVLSVNTQIRLTNPYEASSQNEWLRENPLLVISKDENLNNQSINIEAAAAAALPPSAPSAALPPSAPSAAASVEPITEASSSSLLIPEDTSKGEETGEQESEGESEGTGSGEKTKTVRFDVN